jgi:hypothetical protein
LELVIRDEAIEPDSLLLPRGSAVTVLLSNESQTPRLCTVPGLAGSVEIAPSETASVTMRLASRRERLRCDDPSRTAEPVFAMLQGRT